MKQITLYLLSLFVSVLLLVGCSNEPPTPEELYKEEASGVVMVLNKFYYNVTLPSGDHLYFTSIGEDGTLTGLTDDINEIRKNCGYMTGTAFFINDRGMLLTNRHVASPIIDEAQVKQSLMNIIRYVKALYEARMSNLSDQYNALESQKQECVSEDFWGNVEVDQQRLSQIESEQSELQQQYNAVMLARDGVGNQLDPSCITIHPICELGIAYNDSYVSTESVSWAKILVTWCACPQTRKQTLRSCNFAARKHPMRVTCFPWINGGVSRTGGISSRKRATLPHPMPPR